MKETNVDGNNLTSHGGGSIVSLGLVCVDPSRVREIWPHAVALLRSACRRTTLNALDDVESDVLSGRSLLWLAWAEGGIQATASTILINSDIGKVCVITACGGTGMKRWLPLLDGIESYARDEGCTRVRIYGRKGWLRVLDGYREKHIIMDKEIEA
ncbi:hypothetical protein [Bradyrhizobium sp. Ce-3]|uniref:hypothetical protein n=1 Tax=Bradyrhizobium sp. Ce-3 TaxID=2913970 RepID=UPI001FC8A4D8|nr:hypothetical protein [Bradyrhizobium sp. Ce-3]